MSHISFPTLYRLLISTLCQCGEDRFSCEVQRPNEIRGACEHMVSVSKHWTGALFCIRISIWILCGPHPHTAFMHQTTTKNRINEQREWKWSASNENGSDQRATGTKVISEQRPHVASEGSRTYQLNSPISSVRSILIKKFPRKLETISDIRRFKNVSK